MSCVITKGFKVENRKYYGDSRGKVSKLWKRNSKARKIMEIQPVRHPSLHLQQLWHTIPRILARWNIRFHSEIKKRLEAGQKSLCQILTRASPSSCKGYKWTWRKDEIMATQGIRIKNKGLLLIGVTLLVIGLILSLYTVNLDTNGGVMRTTYPYQPEGIILVVIGIVLTVLGFFLSPHYLITAFERKRAQQTSR